FVVFLCSAHRSVKAADAIARVAVPLVEIPVDESVDNKVANGCCHNNHSPERFCCSASSHISIRTCRELMYKPSVTSWRASAGPFSERLEIDDFGQLWRWISCRSEEHTSEL